MKRMAYAEARPYFQPAGVITWEGTGALSGAIELFTGHRTTHVSMLLMEVRADEPRWLIMEAYEGGHGLLSGEVGDNFLSRKLAGYRGRCVWRDLRPEFDPYRDAICRVLWSHKGKRYDYRSLVRQAGGRVLVDRRAFFCSELIQVALRDGIPRKVLANVPWTDEMRILVDCRIAMQPGDFEDLPILLPGVELTCERRRRRV